jgi:iron(III) transport system substrate-binding protein
MKRILLVAVLVALTPACKRGAREVVVYTSVDQVFSEPVFKEFERQSGIAIRAVFDTEETKSTGVLNRLIAGASSAQADVFWANDPVRPFLLVKRGLAEPYVSPSAAGIPAAFKAADGTWTDFAARARVLLVNRKRVSPGEMPRSVRDLANPRWKGQTAIANPLFGTTTMHVAALFTTWGEEQARAVLLDEPLSNLDVGLKRELLKVVRDLLKERRSTALYVTHDLREAALGDRIAVMEQGRVVQEGTLDSLRARPASSFVRGLLDDLAWAGTAGP